MIKFTPKQHQAVAEADLLANMLVNQYAANTKATYRKILERVAFHLSVKGTLPRMQASTANGAELRLEWYDPISPDDLSGKAKVRLLFKQHTLTKPRFLTAKKVALRQEFIAAWPELAGKLGELGATVARRHGDSTQVEQAGHQGRLDQLWLQRREDLVAQDPRVVEQKAKLAQAERAARQTAEAVRPSWQYLVDDREL